MHYLQPRTSTLSVSEPIYDALVILFVLVPVTLVSFGILLILRRIRQKRRRDIEDIEGYPAKSTASKSRRPTLLTLSGGDSGPYQACTPAMSSVPLPEIRIHFPEEIDETGKQAPGRVVVLRIDPQASHVEPMDHEDLPPYRPLRDPRVSEEMWEREKQ